jgi:hypothetical protein
MYVIGITNLRISKEVLRGMGSQALVAHSALQNPARGRALEQVIGLHHATDPGLKPKFNQAIPLDCHPTYR